MTRTTTVCVISAVLGFISIIHVLSWYTGATGCSSAYCWSALKITWVWENWGGFSNYWGHFFWVWEFRFSTINLRNSRYLYRVIYLTMPLNFPNHEKHCSAHSVFTLLMFSKQGKSGWYLHFGSSNWHWAVVWPFTWNLSTRNFVFSSSSWAPGFDFFAKFCRKGSNSHALS